MLKVKDLTQGHIGRHIYQLALPIMGTNFINMAYSFTDMAWLGRLGSESVAAVGIISVFLWIANATTFLTKTGSEVTIGQAIGRGSSELARSYASHNSALSIGIGIILSATYILFANFFVSLYQPNAMVSGLALKYMQIASLGLPAVFLSNTLFGIYTATGNSHIPFWILGVGMGCNMLLDPLLIHIAGWGVAGAAWATVISQWIVLISFILRLRLADKLLGQFPFFSKLRWAHTKEILRIGLPAASLNVLFAFITIYMGRLASKVGGHVGVAVLTTGGQLEALTWSTAQGVTTALSAIVAQNYAAGKWNRVIIAYKTALTFTSSVGLIGMLYFLWGGEALFALIVPDPETYQAGGIYLGISAYSQIFMMLEITTQGLFYGMGKSYWPASISIFGNILRIPLAIILVYQGLGLNAIWWAISLSATLKGILSIIVLASCHKNWKTQNS